MMNSQPYNQDYQYQTQGPNGHSYQDQQHQNQQPQTMQNPYEQQRKQQLPHLQKRVYPGMAMDQSFDTMQASQQDRVFVHQQQQQQMDPNGYGANSGQGSQDPRMLNQRQSSHTELFSSNPGQTNQKIDGDAMPRPLKMLNATNVKAGIPDRYPTKSNEFPPSAGIPFITIDEGQVGPKYMRGTVVQASIEQAFQTQSNIPFGFLVQPLAEMTQFDYQNEIPDIPLIDYDGEGPFRCYRCKAYVNPNMLFLEGGSKAQCNLCQFINDVPVNYQSALNEFGQRRDRLQRPELQFGAYEFKAPQSYMTRKPTMPTIVFVIDVSQFSLPLGLFQQIVQSIKSTLDYLPYPEMTSVCFMTYDVNLHFYSLPQDPNGEPSVLWVGEIQDPFIPFPRERLMLKLTEDRERIDIFLDKLLNMHSLETKKYQAPFLCTGAAISAAKQLIAEEGKLYNFLVFLSGGRIIVFASNITSSGYGSLMYREDPKLYNTDKEKTLLSPVNDVYVKLAEECIQQRVCVDLIYAINQPKSIDLTSIAPIATLTGGDLHLFSPYDPLKHGEKLHYEVFRIMTRTQATEVAIKARTSTGLTVTEYFGSFGFKEVADFELAAIDSDKTIGFIIRNDEKLKDDPTTMAYVQFAMMYNTQFGEKRIRIFNYNLTVAKNLNGYYKAADQETLSTFLIRRELSRVFSRGAKATRELITNNLVSLLTVYRQKCAAKTPPSQMVLPENLKLLPLYTLTAFKNPALRMFPGVKIDDKVHQVYKLLRMSMAHMAYFLYPRIYKVTNIYQQDSIFYQQAEGSQQMTKPNCTPATMEKLGSQDAYVIDNGDYLFLYLGNQVDDQFIQNVFGYANFSDLKFNGVTSFYPNEELAASTTLWQFLEQLRYEKSGVAYQPVRLIYAGDAQEQELVASCLVEDSVDLNKEFPYTEFLCMLHKLIRNKIQQ